jgi:integrase
MADKRFLEKHGECWRVVVSVPKNLQAAVGKTKLKESLNTDSLALANKLKWAVITRLKKEIEAAAAGTLPATDLDEALGLRKELIAAKSDEHVEILHQIIVEKATAMRGAPIAGITKDDEGDYEFAGGYAFDGEAARQAKAFYAVTQGKATPLKAHLDDYHAQAQRSRHTEQDDERALDRLEAWCTSSGTGAFIEKIDAKAAGRFINEALCKGPAAVQAKTANKYISCLSRYWRWQKQRGLVEVNPWQGQSLPKPKRPPSERSRPFTDDEAAKLLYGSASPLLRDFMFIAALTGARVGAIGALRVADCRDGNFVFQPQKKEPDTRTVPIHTGLRDIIERRTAGKAETDMLFPELPTRTLDQVAEPTQMIVKSFVKYRRSLGIEDVVGDHRQSRVKFHSFRSWFITKAEQAGIAPHIIMATIGHKRPGVTFDVYSRGPSLDQLRECVEAVKLPPRP